MTASSWCEVVLHHGFALYFPNGIEQFSCAYWPFACLFLEKCSRSLSTLNWAAFLLLSCMNSVYILEQDPYQVCDLQLFSPFLLAALSLGWGYNCMLKCFLLKSNLPMLLCHLCFWCPSQEDFMWPRLWGFTAQPFPSEYSQLGLIFVYDTSKEVVWFTFILLHVVSGCSSIICWKDYFSSLNILTPLWKLNWT